MITITTWILVPTLTNARGGAYIHKPGAGPRRGDEKSVWVGVPGARSAVLPAAHKRIVDRCLHGDVPGRA